MQVYYHPNPTDFVLEKTKPPLAAHTYHSYRWKRFFDHISATSSSVYMDYFLWWTCQRWNSSPGRTPSERVHIIQFSLLEESKEGIVESRTFQRECSTRFI
jgi:hypothetical protein